MYSSENVGLGLPVMLKEYGLNYEKRHTKQGIQTNLTLKEESYGDWLPKCRTTLQQPDPPDRHLPVFFYPDIPEGEQLFTLHRIFTRYHTEIKRENER